MPVIVSFLLLLLLRVLLFQNKVSLCNPGCPGTCFVDHAGFEVTDLPASVTRVLGLKSCTIIPDSSFFFLSLSASCLPVSELLEVAEEVAQ